jgi:hypothetical protein
MPWSHRLGCPKASRLQGSAGGGKKEDVGRTLKRNNLTERKPNSLECLVGSSEEGILFAETDSPPAELRYRPG